MKKVLLIIISITFILLNTIIFVGAEVPNITPLWDNTMGVSGAIYFDGTSGHYFGKIIGDADVTNIYATAILYYKDSNGNWIEKHPWAGMSNMSDLFIDKYFTGESGVEYKVELTAYVYVGTDCETVYHTATKTCP